MTRSRFLVFLLVPLALIATTHLRAAHAGLAGANSKTVATSPFHFVESKVGVLPNEAQVAGNPLVDEQGWHYGVAVWKERGKSLWLDGKWGPEFDDFGDADIADAGLVYEYAFSSDGKRLAYVARKSGKMHMVVDGQPQQAEERVGRPTFSPDGKHLAYEVQRKGSNYVLLDGKPCPASDRVCYGIVFSPDSRHVAYLASRENKLRLFIDGKEQVDWPDSAWPTFSPDSKRLASLSIKGGFVVVDGKKGPEHLSNIGSGPVFSLDSRHFACTLGLRTGELWLERAFIDHRPLPLPDNGTGVWHVVFSPNLKRWACFVRSTAAQGSQRVGHRRTGRPHL